MRVALCLRLLNARRTTRNDSNKFQPIHLRPAERKVRREQEKEKED